MYETHFGLEQRPFGETVNPSAYVSLPSRDAVLRRLRYALVHDQGPAVLFGPPGSGKTLLAHRLASELTGYSGSPHLSSTCRPLIWWPTLLTSSARARCLFLRCLSRSVTSATDLRRWCRSEQRPFLVVDDAHLISEVATFDTLRLLLNFTSNGRPDLSLLLVGGAEALARPSRRSGRLASRPAACSVPSPRLNRPPTFSADSAAAGSPSSLFSQDALTALHRAADGIPRRLNRLADLALLIAYAKDLLVVDDAIVRIAAREFHREAA